MHNVQHEPIAYSPKVQDHPLFSYVTEAFDIIDHRFPEGAGDREAPVSGYNYYKLQATLEKLYAFTTAEDIDAGVLGRSIADLQCGSADVFVFYALGHLRSVHHDKSHFNIINLIQNDLYLNKKPLPLASHTFTKVHALLIIGSKEAPDPQTFIKNNRNAIICDLWAREAYLLSELEERRSAEKKLPALLLLSSQQPPFNKRIIKIQYNYLQGDIQIGDHEVLEPLFLELEKLVQSDPLRPHLTPQVAEEQSATPRTKL